MTTQNIQALLDDIRLLGEMQLVLFESVRTLVKATMAPISEEVKYGGIVFSSTVHFCGVFAYQQHVSIEFSHGANIDDPFGHLEGQGKHRRHIKIYSENDIQTKQLAGYLTLALVAAKQQS